VPRRRRWDIGTPQQCAENARGGTEFGKQVGHRLRPDAVIELMAGEAVFHGE
jgi:hypothetical protein